MCVDVVCTLLLCGLDILLINSINYATVLLQKCNTVIAEEKACMNRRHRPYKDAYANRLQ